MDYRFKPQNEDELYDIIEDIVTNQENDPDYKFGLRDIDVSLITDMDDIFSCHKSDKNYEINRKIDWDDPRNNITEWDVSNVTSMEYMFWMSQFNQDISNWNVSNVINMSGMFWKSQFNQDISNWDVSKVTDMSGMFSESPFNQDISNWDVSNVTNMCCMIDGSSFNQNLFLWVDKLNQNVNLDNFNKNSKHKEKFGSIKSLKDFIENQLTPPIWLKQYKESNDREKFQLLKQLKNYDKKFIETLN